MSAIHNLLNISFELAAANDFMLRACLAGVMICLVAGPLGSLMTWRRMSYFGDTLAHSTLLGVSIAVLLNINLYIGLIIICLLVAMLLMSLAKTDWLGQDSLLSILSHTTLALGLIVVTSIKGARVDLLGYLYGDILAVSMPDIYWISAVIILVFLALARLWPALLAITIHEDLAKVEGVAVASTKLAFVLMLALVFAVGMKIIGVLLLMSLFIIPAATARRFAINPEGMAILASILGCVSVVVGLLSSLRFDIPTGPAIVVTASGIFLLSSFLTMGYRK